MKPPSNQPDLRAILDSLRDHDTKADMSEGDTIARAKLLMDQGRLMLDKVSPLAHEALFRDRSLREQFLASKSDCPAYILAIDIRRSTELMLKARSADHFAEFMASLCKDLKGLICDKFGVVDKFTGDGLLVSFPEFFSGPDAGYRAISVAHEAHIIFEKNYKKHRTSFSVVLMDVGLGIGIDYGNVRFMRIAGDLTVVGVPVVYATRVSCAPPGKSVVNQSAYEKLSSDYGLLCPMSEMELDIKHEGRILVHEIRPSKRAFSPADPPWLDV